MITFDINKPRELELLADPIAALQTHGAKFEVEQRSAMPLQVTVYFLNSKGERI